LVGEPKERCHFEDLGIDGNIITDLKYIGWEGVDWIDLAKDRDRCCENSSVSSGCTRCREFLD
jgi:hypothetical protein